MNGFLMNLNVKLKITGKQHIVSIPLFIQVYSLIQVAQDLIDIHKEIFVQNSFDTYEKLRSVSGKKVTADSSTIQEVDSNADDEEMMVDDAEITAKPVSKREPIVDEDGFELVVRKGKKK